MEPNNDKVFSRERLAGYDPERMSRSCVLVVGAGALGQNTAMNLALAGLGELRIVDKDIFEEHNRTRSPAYPLPDEVDRYGTDKAGAVARKLRRLMTAKHPSMYYANNWIQELGDGAFRGVSVVVSCVDSQLARAYLSDKTRQHGLPFIEGGFQAANIRLTCFPAARPEITKTLPCWRCSHPTVEGSFSCANYAQQAEALGVIPAIQNAAAVLGGLQAEAAIQAVHHEPTGSETARCFEFNVRTWKARTVELAKDPKCPGLHRLLDSQPIILQTTADDTVAELLVEMGEHLGTQACIWLPMKTYSKYLSAMPCSNPKCRNIVAVRGPEWRWKMNPRCSDCDGPFLPMRDGAGVSSYAVPELSLSSSPEVLEATCRTIGLAPLGLVAGAEAASTQAHFDDAPPPALFQLPGSLDELYQSGENTP
ncbi:MAG: molybdopterin-synthase adenylyltransferase [Blastocatellia bacterium]|nr:molybdopterin-synthase adenylyltransferase [Blastocatellia bacterium]